ncbi:MAG TPA: stage II sporulation protein M [Patescibacteria group bacterium]|nr:stage II sporulation protein M [Patescibacteria group bacterium]
MNDLIRNFYSENRRWARFILKLFGLSIIFGAILYFFDPGLINQIADIFQSKFGPNPAQNAGLAREIFLQNSQAVALALFGGIILGLSSVLIVFFNGFIIGFVVLGILTASGNFGRNLAEVSLGLLPHGIFELPAFLAASALGLRLGTEWLGKDAQGIRLRTLGHNLKRAIYAVPVLAILLIIAAFIEVFVSGNLIK